MRDRLIELQRKAKGEYLKYVGQKMKATDEKITEAEFREIMDNLQSEQEFIADYLIEQGGVIAPPCKVGDWVWVVDKNVNLIIKRRVSEIRQTDWREIYIHCYGFHYPAKLIGKILFFTEEEANKALEDLRNDTK